MGYWMIQESERCWAHQGRSVRLAELFDEAAACPPFRSLIDTTDPVFATPGDMPARVRQACAANGEPVPESDAELVRCVLDSVALAICSTLEDAQRCAGKNVSVLHVVGGGSANRLFLSLLAAGSGLEVVAGPTEATAIGNLLAQLGSAGKVAGRAEMRQLVARSFPIAHVSPDPVLARAAQQARRRSRT
jgi:rhamnulokinase